jgi:co-chaperonin GroES (HSP10)
MKLKNVIGLKVAIEPVSAERKIGNLLITDSHIEVRKTGKVIALGTEIEDKHRLQIGEYIIYSKASQEAIMNDTGDKIEIVDYRNIFCTIENPNKQ